jgi:hypothetical protein
VSESLDARIWAEHEHWLDCRARLAVVRARWTEDDWSAVRLAADAAWDADPSGLYLYAATDALREHEYRRIDERLARERRFGAEWLLGVLGSTDAIEKKPTLRRER